MDSVNLSETQNTPLNCRNTGCNTSPITCACCGAKDYIQTVPQAFCYPAIHPGIPSFPVIQPFFHNAAIPTNFVCPHSHLDCTARNEEVKQTTNDNDKISRPANHFTLSQKEKNEPRGNITIENLQKINYSGPDAHYQEHPFHASNSGESQQNSLMQRCACGDHSPWTCSPVIAPIISYCLFWNSQKSNLNIIPANYSGFSTETLRQKSDKYPANREHSNVDADNGKSAKTINTVKSANDDGTEATQEDRLDSENNEQNTENSLASLSFNSLNFHEKNSLKDNEKEERSNLQSKNASLCGEEDEEEEEEEEEEEGEEGEDTELETLDCLDQVDSEECLKSEETSNINDECQSPLDSRSHSDLRKPTKNKAHSTDILHSEAQASPSDTSAAGENTFYYLQDRTHGISKNEEYTSGAAMGDLGGDHCEGYKVNILLYEGDQQNVNFQETETEETFPTKEILLRELREFEENGPEKNASESIKSGRSHKSGIAKLSNASKSKDSKTDFTKNLKQSKESHQRESSLTKRKHNCLSTENTTCGNDSSYKIQKKGNFTLQQQFTGPEKLQKELHCKCHPIKKEEKISTTKVRTIGTVQKNVKSNCKNK